MMNWSGWWDVELMADESLWRRLYPPDALEKVVDGRLVEHLHGPNDGELRRVDDNGYRSNGLYIPVNSPQGVTFKQFVPFDVDADRW